MTYLKPSLAALAATSAFLLAAPAAQAWYVDISITGAGRVYETTDADEIDEHCPDAIEGFASPGTTPTGTLGASCRAGDAAGDYGHGWVVRYVAEAAAGYHFAGWQSDGRSRPGPLRRIGRVLELRRRGLPVRHIPEPPDPRALRRRHEPVHELADRPEPGRQRAGDLHVLRGGRSDLPTLRVPGRRGPRVANVQLGSTGEPGIIRDVHVPGPRRGLEREPLDGVRHGRGRSTRSRRRQRWRRAARAGRSRARRQSSRSTRTSRARSCARSTA